VFFGDGGCKCSEIPLKRISMLVRDWPPTDRAKIASGGARLSKAVAERRVRIEIRRRGPRHITDFKPAQAMTNVGGVSDFAHLTVADKVNTRGNLTVDAVLDRF
jgi:hypothetical protein